MVNYGNGKIYKIVNNVDDKIYIGSTCSTLAKRKGQHKANLHKYPNMRSYKHFNEVGWCNIDVILIEAYECKNKDELHKRERHYIDELKPELNKQLPTRSRTDSHRDWRLKNPHKSKEYQEKYKKVKTPEEIEARQQLKEQRALARKQRAKEVITCDCGRTHSRRGKSQHMKSVFHAPP
jgi:group I intron endonuclease